MPTFCSYFQDFELWKDSVTSYISENAADLNVFLPGGIYSTWLPHEESICNFFFDFYFHLYSFISFFLSFSPSLFLLTSSFLYFSLLVSAHLFLSLFFLVKEMPTLEFLGFNLWPSNNLSPLRGPDFHRG